MSVKSQIAELNSAGAWLRALEGTAKLTRSPHSTLPTLIGALAERQGSKPALLSDSMRLSFGELFGIANNYARWAVAHGVGPGVVVSLIMSNSPIYLAIWLGIARVRGVVALINTRLTGGDPPASIVNSFAASRDRGPRICG